jgi:GxxExxY protein
MPISCPITFPRLTTEEFAALDYKIMKSAFACHSEIGRLADESVYQADFSARLMAAGYEVHREVPITVTFHTFVKTYYMDVVVVGKAIYELKTVRRLTAEHEAQVLNYLLLVDSSHGKVINFRQVSVDSRFVNAPITLAKRRAFVVNDRDWRANPTAKEWLVELLREWGTGLELPLYHQALVHLLGGDELVTKQLAMTRGTISLGTQRFHLLEDDAAFRITAFGQLTNGHGNQLKRLLSLSHLKALHWINIGYEEVTFSTIT